MIRINLLPVRAARKAEQGKIQIFVGALIIAGALAGNYFFYDYHAQKLALVKRQVTKTRAAIAEIESKIGKVKDIQKKKEELEKKLEVIEKLRLAKTGPVKVMDSLATLIPKEVWIEQFSEKENRLVMKGEALTHEDIAAFIAQLQSSPYFKSVELKRAQTPCSSKSGDDTVVCFDLTGQADYTAE